MPTSDDYQHSTRRVPPPIEFVEATFADSRRRSIMRHNESVLNDQRRRQRRDKVKRMLRWL